MMAETAGGKSEWTGGAMRLATFNLESLGSTRPGAPPLDQRIAVLRPQFERLDADILCLQEVNGQPAAGAKARQLAALSALFAGTRYDGYALHATQSASGAGVHDVHNLVVATHLPVAAVREVRHALVEPPLFRPLTAEPPEPAPLRLGWDRPLLHLTLTLADGRPLHVVNLHLRAPLAAPVAGQKLEPFVWKSVESWAEGFFIAAMKRLGQAVEARRLVDAIFAHDPEPLIALAGDFNADDHEAPLRIAIGSEDDTGNGALAGRMLVPAERALPQDRRYSVTHHGRPQMLDHILLSRALMGHLRGVEVHNEALLDELIGPSRTLRPPDSFHAPLVAEFAL